MLQYIQCGYKLIKMRTKKRMLFYGEAKTEKKTDEKPILLCKPTFTADQL